MITISGITVSAAMFGMSVASLVMASIMFIVFWTAAIVRLIIFIKAKSIRSKIQKENVAAEYEANVQEKQNELFKKAVAEAVAAEIRNNNNQPNKRVG